MILIASALYNLYKERKRLKLLYLTEKLDKKREIERKELLHIENKMNDYLLIKKISKKWNEFSLEEKIDIKIRYEAYLENSRRMSDWWIKKKEDKKKEIKRQKDLVILERENQLKLRKENEEIELQLKLKLEKEIREKEIALEKSLQLKTRRDLEEKEYFKRQILEKERKKQIESEAIQELLNAGLIDNNYYSGSNTRESIPTDVKVMVWNRDRERCVNCSSNTNLEFDHIIPISKGGANSVKNIQLLCRNCNRTKSNKII